MVGVVQDVMPSLSSTTFNDHKHEAGPARAQPHLGRLLHSFNLQRQVEFENTVALHTHVREGASIRRYPSRNG